MLTGYGRALATRMDRVAELLPPPCLVRLVGRQQLNDQSDQLAGGEHDGPLVLVLARLVIFAVVIGGILWVTHSDLVGRLAEVVAQVAVAGVGEARLIGLEVGGLSFAPLQAGELGHLGLIVVEALDSR